MANVYKGFWINWQEGRVRGANLTLSTTDGLILVSFVTLYVQYAGTCFWRMLCFILHQIRSTTDPRDGLFHQQQIVLRNAITAPHALWSFGRLGLAWRGKAKNSIRKSVFLVFCALIHIAIFAAAGLFSSQITDTVTGQALVQEGVCGFTEDLPNLAQVEPSTMNPNDLIKLATEALLGRITFTKSLAHVRTCYNAGPNSDSATCNNYVQPRLEGINSTAVTNASCPFGNDACAAPAVRYDSGAIHSGNDLGINSPQHQSLSIRRITSCAPILAQEKYATEWIDNVPEMYVGGSNTSARFYEFGASRGESRCATMNVTAVPPTFCTTRYERENFRATYTINSVTSYHNNLNKSGFEPIPDFQVPNSDVTLISILNRAEYNGEVYDPLFNARNVSSESNLLYTSTNDLSILACTEQYQLCNLANQRCSNLTGLYGIQDTIDNSELSLDGRQHAISKVIWKSAWAMAMQWAVEVMGDNILLARDWMFTDDATTSAPLPPQQWQLESWNLHNLSLAVLQRRITEYAQPENFQIRPDLNSLTRIEPQTDPNMQALCALQKIRSSAHSSVSVLGLCIILVVGGLFILFDWVLVQQIFWVGSFSHSRHTKKAEWINTGALQLHRGVLEVRGVGPWKTSDYEFPTLTGGQRFAGLGAEGEGALQLEEVEGKGLTRGNGHKGTGYTAVPSQGSGLEADMKGGGEDGNGKV